MRTRSLIGLVVAFALLVLGCGPAEERGPRDGSSQFVQIDTSSSADCVEAPEAGPLVPTITEPELRACQFGFRAKFISQTAQFATSGSTQGGIIALSLAKAPSIAKLGEFALIPESMHKPLKQRMVLMKDAPPALRAFYGYLGTPAAQTIMVRYGFAMPKE